MFILTWCSPVDRLFEPIKMFYIYIALMASMYDICKNVERMTIIDTMFASWPLCPVDPKQTLYLKNLGEKFDLPFEGIA